MREQESLAALLERLTELEAEATTGPWEVGKHNGDPASFLAAAAAHHPENQHVWCVMSDWSDLDDAVVPAVTGNGPTSEINAAFLV
jgi:hypothetical protein